MGRMDRMTNEGTATSSFADVALGSRFLDAMNARLRALRVLCGQYDTTV